MIQAFYFQGIWIIGKKLNFYRWLFQICVHCRPAAVYFYPCGCCFVFSLEKGVLFVKPYTLKFLRILKKKTKLFHKIISHSCQWVCISVVFFIKSLLRGITVCLERKLFSQDLSENSVETNEILKGLVGISPLEKTALWILMMSTYF